MGSTDYQRSFKRLGEIGGSKNGYQEMLRKNLLTYYEKKKGACLKGGYLKRGRGVLGGDHILIKEGPGRKKKSQMREEGGWE